MPFAVLAFACVMYTDGTEHCDVRSKYIYEASSFVECKDKMAKGVMKVADSAFENPDVSYITMQESYCYSDTATLQSVLDIIPGFMEATGRSFTHTKY